MGSIVKGARLTDFMSDPTFVLKGISPRYKYENNARTEQLLGYNYRVVNRSSFDTIIVTVNQATPIISLERMQEADDADENIIVEITGATVTPYYSERTKSVEDSIKATSIKLVDEI